MSPKIKYLLGCLACCLVWPWGACRQVYTPPAILTNLNLLVVDGMLNGGAGQPTIIHLSRSQEIGDSTLGVPVPEPHANIVIQGDGGDNYAVPEQGSGTYVSANLTLNGAHKYRLQITTANGSKYMSDYVPVLYSPPIDSITWQQQGDVTVYANTHDPSNQSHYYQWFFTETWEYHAPLESELALQNGLIVYAIDSISQVFLIYKCWRSENSTDVLLGNSTALGEDRISEAPIATLPIGSQKLSVRYSTLVSQNVLTQAAYQYWLILQKNTQNLGTLFDPQPSQSTGNYHCLTNPREPVIGYLSASSITQKRLFIDNSQVSNWDTVQPGCPIKITDRNPVNFQIYTYPDTVFGPYYFSGDALYLTRRTCTDCREQGGTTTKPSYW